jgi:hypothetical protein
MHTFTCQLLKTFQMGGHYPRPFFASSTYLVFSPPRVQPLLFSFFIAPICFCEPTFVFLQRVSLPFDHKSHLLKRKQK